MPIKIWILTHFPIAYDSLKEMGVIGKVLREGNEFELRPVLISQYCKKGFKGLDASPYGGGDGMVLRADALKEALLKGVVEVGEYGENWREKLHVVFPGPRGSQWSNLLAKELACKIIERQKDLVFICGRYEGVDERFLRNYIDQEISIGDYVLSGGDIAVMTIIDSTLRFFPGVLGNQSSSVDESFENNLLEHSQYTRPEVFEGEKVPEVLLSGNHQKIKAFREKEKLEVTKSRRPDLISKCYKENLK
jgi:tRNA (guanine37-N1)-methyltransferase